MVVTIICNKDQSQLVAEGEYSEVRARVTNFLIDHTHNAQ